MYSDTTMGSQSKAAGGLHNAGDGGTHVSAAENSARGGSLLEGSDEGSSSTEYRPEEDGRVGNEIQNESFGYAGYLLDDITRSTAAETEATSIAETEATSTARDGSDVDGRSHAKRCLIMYFECGTSII